MPWESADVSEQRVKFVVRAASGKENMTALCRLFGISRTTGYRWRGRFEQTKSLAAVAERSRRPQHCPTRTAAREEQRVMALRRKYGWGAKKLAVLLGERGAALPVITVHRILKRHGLVRVKDTHSPALQRFEHSAPNQLWQMDGKGEYRGGEASCYPLSILDDHSRYLVGLYGLRAFTAEQVYPCLLRTFERYGLPEAMLMDRGSIWWGTRNGYGLTWLSVRLIEQGIELRYGRPHHPQTQGKVERLHRTLDEAMRYRGKPRRLAEWDAALEKFRQVYNEQRPHEALQMQRPAERYRASARKYQHGAPLERSRMSVLEQKKLVRVRGVGRTACTSRTSGSVVGGKLPAHVRAGDRLRARLHARDGLAARGWEGTTVALRARCAPSQPTKSKTLKCNGCRDDRCNACHDNQQLQP